jgi:SAM-dependent methyltransferase
MHPAREQSQRRPSASPPGRDFATVPDRFLGVAAPEAAQALEKAQSTWQGPYFRFGHVLLPAPRSEARRLVDIGGGNGGWAVYARAHGWDVTVVDASPGRLECVRALGIAALRHDLNLPLPFEAGSFHGAVMSEVLEHIPMAERLLGEIGRVLIPGGFLVLTTPNNAYYKRRIRALQGRSPDDEGIHFRFFVRKKLARMMEAAGFRIRERRSYGTIPLLDRLLLRRWRSLGRRRVVIPAWGEALLADRFVWLLERGGTAERPR